MWQYKWILSYGVHTLEAHPDWKDDLAREYAFEQNQMFRRSQLSSAITFQRDDYDFIMNAPFGTKINVTLQIKRYEHSIFLNYWNGYFYHTDCTVNTDDKTIKVKPSVEDKYNKILAGLDKEFDLIKLKPACQTVRYQRRAMLQIYTKGESIVSCFMGGMSWEQEVTDNTISSGDLQNTYHFGILAQLVQISIASAPAGLTDGFIGSWDYGRQEGEWDCFGNNLGVYHMTYFQEYEQSSQQHKYTNGLRIYAVGTTTPIIWEYKQSFQSEFQNDYEPIPASFTLTAKQSGYTNLSASWIGSDIFGRWMLGSKLSGAYDVPDNDVVAYNRNYKYCYPYAMQSIIRTTTRSSATNTGYGQKPDGTYYDKPQLSYDEALITRALFPIGRTTWETWSIWLWWTTTVQNQENDFRSPIWLRDAYTIEAVISALLGEIDNTITFAADTNHSVFLYGTNPLTNDWGRLLMTPKSNVIVAEYSQPAQKAPIKLNNVLQMLQKACGCYWYIDGSNRLRIEHISYFKNGYAYPPASRVIGWDLTTMECQRNGQKWSLGTGTYQYDKIEMPERYEFAWMDETTNGFAGVPIEVLSGFVEEGKIEEVNIAEFNSDIDYITLNPNDVSEDGFALMCAKIVGGVWQLGFDEFTINGDKILLQNYQLAMIALQPAFLISDMPSWSIKVNGTMITSKGIQRKKKQQLNVPMVTPNDGNMYSLVKTTIGNGEIERASIKLTSRMTKFTLRYDTTEQ